MKCEKLFLILIISIFLLKTSYAVATRANPTADNETVYNTSLQENNTINITRYNFIEENNTLLEINYTRNNTVLDEAEEDIRAINYNSDGSRRESNIIPFTRFLYLNDSGSGFDLNKISRDYYLLRNYSLKKPFYQNVSFKTNNLSMNYEASVTNEVLFLGLFKINSKIDYVLDSKGGVVSQKQPWFNYFSTAITGYTKQPINGFLADDVSAKLEICMVAGSCSGDAASAYVSEDITINEDASNKKRTLSFSTTNPSIKQGLLQISLTPFNGEVNHPIIYSKNVNIGDFILDFGKKFTSPEEVIIGSQNNVYSEPNTALLNNSANNNIFANKQIIINTESDKILFSALETNLITDLIKVYPKYYLRVIPMNNSKIVGLPSNDVSVEIVASQNSSITLYSVADLYDVTITEFTPLLAPDNEICPYAVILDTDWSYTDLITNEKTIIAYAGQRICPSPYMGIGEDAWYESLWNAIKSGLSWVSEAYNVLKSSIVDVVGSAVCFGSSDCETALSAGLDIGLAAMGIPPSIPNFDELMDQGFNYLASELAEQAGCPDVVCKELIKDQLESALELTKNNNPSCPGETEAHQMGIEPLCLPADVKSHWDPLATYRDAKIVLEITRNYKDVNPSTEVNGDYRVTLTSTAFNSGPVGSWITNIEPNGKSMQITQPLNSFLFDTVVISIPDLEKGEKIEIPINLVAADYWIPGHKELMDGWTTVIYKDGWPQYQYNDWWKLYYGANLTINANINGCSYGFSNTCIISEDSYSTTLPMTLNP